MRWNHLARKVSRNTAKLLAICWLARASLIYCFQSARSKKSLQSVERHSLWWIQTSFSWLFVLLKIAGWVRLTDFICVRGSVKTLQIRLMVEYPWFQRWTLSEGSEQPSINNCYNLPRRESSVRFLDCHDVTSSFSGISVSHDWSSILQTNFQPTGNGKGVFVILQSRMRVRS